MSGNLNSLNPALLWKHFEKICSIPHPSRKEKQLAEYIISIGKANNLETVQDKFGNVVIRKPATPGYENRKTAVLQGHLDMVAEKNADVAHDFEKDPIIPYIDGDWVKAKGTTLGADNGIGAAAALAVLESNDIEHGPLEFLFTLDEETGLNGAKSLSSNFLKGDILINLDSEEEGALYIGCAGGKNSVVKFDFKQTKVPKDSIALEITVKGLQGGHSGLNISEERGNAVRIISRVLYYLTLKPGVMLASLNGGSKHNAIPREAFAAIVVKKAAKGKVLKAIDEFNAVIKNEIKSVEKNFELLVKETAIPKFVIDPKTQLNVLAALFSIPNGVVKMSMDIPGLVETSSNLAVVKTAPKNITVTLSHRSSVESEKNEIADRIKAIFELAGAKVKHGEGYPGWQPDINSPILKTMKSVFMNLYNKEPEVKAIHAGLECGIIKEKFPHMDMISFGPTIQGAHSPDEKVQISAVKTFWELLLASLKGVPNR